MKKTKEAVAFAAAELIQDGMIVGLGSGTTATCFIRSLIQRCRKGLTIQAVGSSHRSLQLAKEGGIPVTDLDKVSYVDITVDGADEIDPKKRMIKGRGGAHVREKILASASKELIIIVDETKLVEKLGKGKLPIEVLPFGHLFTEKKLKKKGYLGKWRLAKDGAYYQTDNGNFLFDITFPHPLNRPEDEEEKILKIPGVVDTGFFFHLAGRLLVGYKNGKVEIQ